MFESVLQTPHPMSNIGQRKFWNQRKRNKKQVPQALSWSTSIFSSFRCLCRWFTRKGGQIPYEADQHASPGEMAKTLQCCHWRCSFTNEHRHCPSHPPLYKRIQSFLPFSQSSDRMGRGLWYRPLLNLWLIFDLHLTHFFLLPFVTRKPSTHLSHPHSIPHVQFYHNLNKHTLPILFPCNTTSSTPTTLITIAIVSFYNF